MKPKSEKTITVSKPEIFNLLKRPFTEHQRKAMITILPHKRYNGKEMLYFKMGTFLSTDIKYLQMSAQ